MTTTTTKDKVKSLISENKINPNNFKDLSVSLNIPYKTLKWYYYKLREKPTEENTTRQTEQEKVTKETRLKISIEQKENDLYLYVKTSKEFEKYLKDNKEILNTENLFSEHKNGSVYQYRFITRPHLDNINTPIFYNGRINFGILRVVGISDGLNFKINGLLPESFIKKGIRELVKAFKDFYKTEIERTPILITGEVESHIIEKEVFKND